MAGVGRMNEQELNNLATNAAKIQSSKCISWMDALQETQVALFPEEKRYSKGSLYTLSKKLRERIGKGEIVVNPVVTKPPIQVASEPVIEQPSAETKPLASPGLERFTFGNKITELVSDLARQFEEQLTTELESALNVALGNVERSFAKKLEDARKVTGQKRQQLPRVMVIGVMGEVAFQTESEYGEMLDLRFYKQEENLSLIRSQAKHCDYVVLIVGHINHGHQDCVREHPGLIFCNGGVTQMKEILLTLACK